ncbi:MAG: LAGLIDADG family homing endonuclease, partial [Bacteroidota bacterium]
DFFDQGKRRTYRVTTDRGDELVCTGNHRVRVLKDGHFDWCIARKLQEGTYLPSAVEYPFSQEVPSLPPADFVGKEKKQDRYGNEMRTPSEVTPSLAYLLGAWDGDGNVRNNGIEFTGNRKEIAVRDKIEASFLDVFNQPLERKEFPSRPGSFDLSRWSMPVKRWFESVAGKRAKEIPQVIWKSPKHLVLEYLKGIFDTDGWINNQGVIGIRMSCEEYLRDLQMILFALGFDCHLGKVWSTIKGKKYSGWTLRLRGKQSSLLFRDLIGFSEPHKRERLEKFCNHPRKSDKRTYPIPETYMKAFCQVHPKRAVRPVSMRTAFFRSPETVEQTQMVRHTDIVDLLELAGVRGVESAELGFLQKVISLRFSTLASVELTGKTEQVWDIEVEGDHEYQTNGLLSHNCERSSDVVTSTYVDDDLRKASMAQFQCLKTRDNAPFDVFRSQVEWSCRRMKTFYEVDQIDGDLDLTGDDMEDLFDA